MNLRLDLVLTGDFFIMFHKRFLLVLILCGFVILYLTIPSNTFASQEKLVIAHRGASGYVPEHTLEGAVLAFAMKADFLELDVVMTSDGHLIVMHDLTLNATTNVDEIFPDRSGTNGKHLSMEFSLAEVKRLRVHERSNKRGSGPAFIGRFPYESSLFEVPTLEEILKLVNGLKKSHGRIMGLYIEIKGAEIHRQYNLDPAAELLAILERYDYLEASDPIWIQSFDAEVLKTLRHKHKTRLKLVQLIGENRWRLSATDFDYLKTKTGLKEVVGYADGIGPWMNHVVTGKNLAGDLKLTGIVSIAHQLNLKVHPYTMREDRLPDYVETFEDLLHIFFNVVQVDGIFTDFPDQAVKYLEKTSIN